MKTEIDGWEQMDLAEILTGDPVMLHPEDQTVYTATRTRSGVTLTPRDGRAASLTFARDVGTKLWVRS